MSFTTRPAFRWLTIALLAIVATLAGAWFGSNRPVETPSADVMGLSTLKSLALPDDKGTPYPLGQFDGQTLVLNFWATWCAPCIEEMPELSSLQQDLERSHTQSKVQIVGIGVDSAAKIAEFAQKRQIAYPLLVAGAGGLDLVRQFGNDLGGLPFTVVIGADGQIIDKIRGRVDISALRKRLLLVDAGAPTQN